jgi:hypothetical protein
VTSVRGSRIVFAKFNQNQCYPFRKPLSSLVTDHNVVAASHAPHVSCLDDYPVYGPVGDWRGSIADLRAPADCMGEQPVARSSVATPRTADNHCVSCIDDYPTLNPPLAKGVVSRADQRASVNYTGEQPAASSSVATPPAVDTHRASCNDDNPVNELLDDDSNGSTVTESATVHTGETPGVRLSAASPPRQGSLRSTALIRSHNRRRPRTKARVTDVLPIINTDGETEWLDICRMATSMSIMFSQLNLPSNFDQPVVDTRYSKSVVTKQAAHAVRALGLDIVYNEALFATLGLKVLSEEHHSANDRLLDSGVSLDTILQRSADMRRDKGDGFVAVSEMLEGYPNRDRVVEMLQVGQRPFMKSTFRHNNGVDFKQCKSVRKMGRILVNTLVKLIESGKAVAFSKEAVLRSSESMTAGVSISPLKWATKQDNVLGRTCNNLTHGTDDHPSVNASVDEAAHDDHYAPFSLCDFRDLCELAMSKQEQYPGEQISGATVDVKDAYQQGANTPGVSRLYGTQMDYISPVTLVRTVLWVFYVVGVFGFTRAGHVYNTFASAIDALHNRSLPHIRSHTYVDDGILIDAERLIPTSVAEYCKPVVSFFGPSGINDDKIKMLDKRLEAIGWVLCFKTWRVFPREKGRNKMLAYLIHIIPPGCKLVSKEHLETLTGILSWYSDCIPAGRSFLGSLFRSLRNVNVFTQRCKLTKMAQNDLTWWRALAIVAHRYPYLVGNSIANSRKFKVPQLYLQTDASTSVGGGATVSESLNGPPLSMEGQCIRWTREEMMAFISWNVTINVLEYFTVIYYVMFWAHLMAGKVIHIECDNTSAVKWLVSNRVKSECEGADTLAKLFSLFCLTHNITIICIHIKGELNVIADLNSRSLLLAAQDADEEILAGTRLDISARQVVLRRLLYDCVTSPTKLVMHELLSRLTQVRLDRG